MQEYTAIIVKDGEWYCGSIIEVPGAISQAKTIEELRENLKEALQLILQTMRERALRDTDGMDRTLEKVSLQS